MSLYDTLANKHLTVSCAESCTGGLIGAEITSAPGASSFFLGSAVTYANSAKENILKVPLGILVRYGAVSAQTAVCMADGARRLYGSDIAVAVTGIAGPGGATPDKPIGLVYIAVTSDAFSDVRRFDFSGGRETVRRHTVSAALGMLGEAADAA